MRVSRPFSFCGLSIHALREEGDVKGQGSTTLVGSFYPRPPRGGRPLLLVKRYSAPFLSIHALREEGDIGFDGYNSVKTTFYPRPPRGGRQRVRVWCCQLDFFLSTPSARRATRRGARNAACGRLSIHALREEGDPEPDTRQATANIFLSTPSARRATSSAAHSPISGGSFYPRPPRGGRPGVPSTM